MFFLVPATMLLVILVIFLVANTAGFFFGAPFAPTPKSKLEGLFTKLDLSNSDIIYDLGSGDGRVLLAAARRGHQAVGFEINPVLCFWSWMHVWQNQAGSKVKIYCGSFWNRSLSEAKVVFAFILPQYMNRLEKKLAKEVKKGTYVVTYLARLPGRKPMRQEDGIYVYEF